MYQLHRFASYIRPMIKEAISHDGSKIGISYGEITIQEAFSGALHNEENSGLLDRFKISIPYGGIHLYWEIMFQENEKEYPPDFEFNDDNFNPEITNIKSLVSWDYKNKESLILVLQELINEYKRQQLEKIIENNCLKETYENLEIIMKNPEFNYQSVEVYGESKARSHSLNILVQLPIDFSVIPEIYRKDCLGNLEALLFIRYSDTNKQSNQLITSKDLEKALVALGGLKVVHIPQIFGDQTLSDYVYLVTAFIRDQVDSIAEDFQKKKDYISEFLKDFNGKCLEYDGEYFKSISLLLEWNEFHFKVKITLPSNFPESPPVIKLSSVYHLTISIPAEPFELKLLNFPFSPRWQSSEMMEKTMSFILEKVEVFKRASLSESK